ncbi:MAG: ATP-binding protein [Magnetococcales bacterium]|nr:ATP-binding protein [Magnetococcales bacterium]
MATSQKSSSRIRLKELTIENFKAIDHITLKFDPPRMRADPDIYVMGSRNGIGKTSILESCALIFLAAYSGEEKFNIGKIPELSVNLSELFVRSGAEKSNLIGVFSSGAINLTIHVQLSKKGVLSVTGDRERIKKIFESAGNRPAEDLTERFFMLLAGFNMEPVTMPPCLYFHSYRKVQEGNPELGMMVESEMMMHRRMVRTSYGRMRISPGDNVFVSTFKLHILRAMMGRANLFEKLDSKNADETFEKLNGLILRYAGGTIEKLRPSLDNTVDFRITPKNGGDSFAFDGLSSGQKEIISTLFLVWHYTRNQPCIVLIDEPELHLNAEWHRDFVQQIFKLAPENQYIFATHSEDIFKSVNDDRRLFLGMEETSSQSVHQNGEDRP